MLIINACVLNQDATFECSRFSRVLVLAISLTARVFGVASEQVDPLHVVSKVTRGIIAAICLLNDLFERKSHGCAKCIWKRRLVVIVKVEHQRVVGCRQFKRYQNLLVPDDQVIFHGVSLRSYFGSVIFQVDIRIDRAHQVHDWQVFCLYEFEIQLLVDFLH